MPAPFYKCNLVGRQVVEPIDQLIDFALPGGGIGVGDGTYGKVKCPRFTFHDALLPGIDADTVIADKALDADERVIEPLRKAGKVIVIPPKANRTTPREYDQDLYKARHLIENFFARLKQFRAIATRYDKRATNFLGAIYLAASLTWLN